MLITFKSSASAEIVMYKKHIQELFTIIGKDLERGVITPEETKGIIDKINQYIFDCNKQHEYNTVGNEQNTDEEENYSKQEVSISARLFPLLEMLIEGNQKQKNILWGV
jgi:hypothetical protein